MEQTIKVQELKRIPFPECSINCAMITLLGVGECDAVCPHKFEGVEPNQKCLNREELGTMAEEYNVIFMANDGEYVVDSTHSSEEECAEIINNIGSKWFFYPIPIIRKKNKIVWAPDEVLDNHSLLGNCLED